MRVLLICLIVAAMATINGAQAQNSCSFGSVQGYKCTTTAFQTKTNVAESSCLDLCCNYGETCKYYQYQSTNTGGDDTGTCGLYNTCNSAPATNDYSLGTRDLPAASKGSKLFNQLIDAKRV